MRSVSRRELVNNYPSTENWALAVSVVRDLGKFQQQEQIDLLRLMERTKAIRKRVTTSNTSSRPTRACRAKR